MVMPPGGFYTDFLIHGVSMDVARRTYRAVLRAAWGDEASNLGGASRRGAKGARGRSGGSGEAGQRRRLLWIAPLQLD